ncbi:Sorting nexin mvp1 [Nowakowskiella sp. JEL0078]|nr:Sorting nexin mvp1 [Nowakowskiella sp. JEL0078]
MLFNEHDLVAPPDLDDRIKELKANMDKMLDHYRHLCSSMECIAKRAEETANDFLNHSVVLKSVIDLPDCISHDCMNCPLMNSGFDYITHGLEGHSRTINEQRDTMLDGIIESLKTHRDLLLALKDLFVRWDRVVIGFNVDSLSRRLSTNKKKYASLVSKGQGDVERLSDLIDRDTNELNLHNKRTKFIRHCVWDELRVYHQHKAFISIAYQTFVGEQTRFATQQLELWKSLTVQVYQLPTTGFL